MRELNEAGIPAGVLIAPLMPGINDAPEQVEEILEPHGGGRRANSIGCVGLHLRGEVREIWFDWLRQYRPDLLPRYEALYARGAYHFRGLERAALTHGPRRTGPGARPRDLDEAREPRARGSGKRLPGHLRGGSSPGSRVGGGKPASLSADG